MRLLAITYERDAGPGVFADAVAERGLSLDEWLVPERPEPPADPRGYDAVLVLGGAMHSDQEEAHPWLRTQKGLIREILESGTPLLGACLGAQLVTEAAGGLVRRMPEPEIGWYDVELTPEGETDPLVGPLGPRLSAMEWHSYECLPPGGAAILARSAACVQAFRVGERAWGIQFHAEVTRADVNSWIDDWRSDEDAVRIGLDHEALRALTNERIGSWNDLGRALCGRFLDAVAAPAVRG